MYKEIESMVFSDDYIQQNHLSKLRSISVPLNLSLDEVELMVITQTLEKFGNDKSRTARELGIGSRTLSRKLRKLGITSAGDDREAADPSAEAAEPLMVAEPAVRRQRAPLPPATKALPAAANANAPIAAPIAELAS